MLGSLPEAILRVARIVTRVASAGLCSRAAFHNRWGMSLSTPSLVGGCPCPGPNADATAHLFRKMTTFLSLGPEFSPSMHARTMARVSKA